MQITFLPDQITIEAQPGEPLLDVAERAGVTITTGCRMGSCHACEVEINDGLIICACITGIPGDKEQMTVNVAFDPVW